MHRRGFLIGLIVFVAFPVAGPADGADRDARLRANLIDWYARQAPSVRAVQRYMRTLKPDGSWPDIDYTSKRRGSWSTCGHVIRTLDMAQAYQTPGHSLAGNPQLRTAITNALTHWLDNDYINPNWWYPQIGVPKVVAPTLILMGDDIPTELTDGLVQRVLSRSKMGMTGQNKVWLAGIAVMKGVLTGDHALIAAARDQIVSELHVTTAEGIQPDFSFHQHGPQQQWGNYGASFAGDMVTWASIFRGTDYAFSSHQIEVLGRYLAEGSAWVLWQGRMDVSGCGRQVFENAQSSKGRAILRQLELMTAVDPERADVYRTAADSNREDAANTLIGHKHFWRSDITIHRAPTWYASVKMSSTRVIGAETCNSENLQGLHLGDGVTCFYRTGAEYEDLFPVWDWRRLPGTTCLQNTESLVPGSERCRGQSDFVGGLSTGSGGVAAMEYLRDNLRARKTWFFIADAVVCLGAGIDCNDPKPVWTSLNQCALNGPVTIATGQQTRRLSPRESLTIPLQWAHHDGIGYVLLEPQTTTVRAATQTGNWGLIHPRDSVGPIERDIFSLWIDHGPKPDGARYAYAVLPDATLEQTRAFHDAPPVTILQQTPSLQAVATHDSKQIQAAFFDPGHLTWGDRSSIEVDVPCLIALDCTTTPARLHVADPTHRQSAVNVRITGKYAAPNTHHDATSDPTELTIQLPTEGLAGRTVTVELHE